MLGVEDGMGAEGHGTGCLRGIETVTGLEPLPGLIYQRDQGDGRSGDGGGEIHQAIEVRFR